LDTTPPSGPDAPSTRATGPGALPLPPERFYRQLDNTAKAVLIVAGTVYLLQTFALVLQQLCTAALIGYLIVPAHHWLVRHRISSLLATVVIIVGTLLWFSVLGNMIYSSVEDLGGKIPAYQDNLVGLVRKVAERVPGLDVEPILHAIRGSDGQPTDPKGRAELPLFQSSLAMLKTALGGLFGFLSQSVVVLVYLVFLLAEQASVRQRIEQAFGFEASPQIMTIVGRINGSITQYLAVKTCMGLAAGSLTWLVLRLFGVDYAVLFGVLAFLLNYIPYLGSMVATLLPVLLALLQIGEFWPPLVILAVLLVVQNVIGYAIEPRIAGKRLDLSPLVIILALAFWGSLWGIVGMILAVPLVVVIKTVLENIPATRPIAVLLSNV